MPSIYCCFGGIYTAYYLGCKMVKILHYCWFGGNPLPESTKRYMETWKKFCPDYVIKRWDESNFGVNSVPFVAEAYAAKKWAFVSDYVRTYALYHEGGLYVDTDVEFVKGIDDLTGTSFMGFELPDIVNPGLILFAKVPHEEFFGEILKRYANLSFDEKAMSNITIPILYTQLLSESGLLLNNSLQRIGNITVYPMEYFQPMGSERHKLEITENTRSVHHYDASWLSEADRTYFQYRMKFGQGVGKMIFCFIHPIYAWKFFLRSRHRRKEQISRNGAD